MKYLSLRNLYAGIVLIIIELIVIHAPLSVFFGSHFEQYAPFIKAWKEMLMAVGVVLMLVLIHRQKRWREFIDDRLLQLIGIYTAIHLFSLLAWNGLTAAAAGLVIDLRYIVYFVLVYVLLRLYPQFKRWFVRLVLLGALVVIGFGTLQIVLPPDFLRYFGYGETTIQPYLTIDQNADFIRLQSTLRGPNPYGAYAASVAIMALAWLVARKRRMDWRVAIVGVLAAIGTYLSYARSAYIALALGVALVLVVRYGRKLRLRHWVVAGAVAVSLVASLGALSHTDFVSNVVLHEDPGEGGMTDSNDGHWTSLVRGLQAVAESPAGHGIGSSGSASLFTDEPHIIENQYLFIAHEVGILGLITFVAIMYIIMRRLWRLRVDAWALGMFASGVGLLVIGLLLPVWADDTVAIVWWGLAAALLATSKK